jgi:hypothetical protein
MLLFTAKDKTPGWTLYERLRSLFGRAGESGGRLIVFIHYAGRGTERANGRLVNFDNYIDLTVDVTHYGGVGNTDIVWILDCCYAHKGY